MTFSLIVGALSRFLLVTILARFLISESYGVWVSITSVAAIIIYGDMGLTNALRNKTPYQYMKILSDNTPNDTCFTVDIGQNQMWSAQVIKISDEQTFFTSRGHFPMGYALQTAIGASMGFKNKKVIAICGDRGFHISTQALMLISQYNLSIMVFVSNNSYLGMITQFQELYFEKRLAGTDVSGGYLVPKIGKMAESYSLPYKLLTADDLMDEKKINDIFNLRNGIVEVKLEGNTKVSPKLEYNKPIDQASPFLTEVEYT